MNVARTVVRSLALPVWTAWDKESNKGYGDSTECITDGYMPNASILMQIYEFIVQMKHQTANLFSVIKRSIIFPFP